MANLICKWKKEGSKKDKTKGITVRLDVEYLAKVKALKQVFPKSTVHSMIIDILEAGIDESIANLETIGAETMRSEFDAAYKILIEAQNVE